MLVTLAEAAAAACPLTCPRYGGSLSEPDAYAVPKADEVMERDRAVQASRDPDREGARAAGACSSCRCSLLAEAPVFSMTRVLIIPHNFFPRANTHTCMLHRTDMDDACRHAHAREYAHRNIACLIADARACVRACAGRSLADHLARASGVRLQVRQQAGHVLA